ncbi:MAG: RNA polymerase sigma-70 factor [Lentimicrobiaceae bacterium]|nr:RNA polymerase sigma-70 factor [Lentimicrobiaceae bacterium]
MYIYDSSLIGKLKNGDISSFEVIYKSHYRRIFHFALQYLRNEEACSNIIQDVFSSLWDNKEKLTIETNLNAWLFTVTKNRCLKYIRDLKLEKRHLGNLAEQRMSLIHDALNSLDTSSLAFYEIEKLIQQTLDSLSPQCRRAFEMSRFDEKKYSEIADEMQIAQKTVETHISNALKIFRITLKDYLPLVIFLFR